MDGRVRPQAANRPRWPRIGGVFGAKWLQEVRRGCVAGKRSPLGEASIASGYTPPALAGAMPPHPQPLKGCRNGGFMKKKKEANCIIERGINIVTPIPNNYTGSIL